MFRLRQFSRNKLQLEPFLQYDMGRRLCTVIFDNIFKWRIFQNQKGCSRLKEYIFVTFSSNPFTLRPRYSSNIPRRHLQIKSDNSPITCWNCHVPMKKNVNTLFCDSCNSLQPVDTKVNFFNILGIENSYNLNQTELKKKFRNLQSLLHPDKYSTKPKKEQELSEEFSSIVNKAYSVLLDPLERGLYMLSLNNISIEEGAMDVDKLFLMEIMERNEEIENETDPVKLRGLYKSNRVQLDLLISKVSKAFEDNNLELATKLLTEMKYYNTIDMKIKDIKQKLNIPD